MDVKQILIRLGIPVVTMAAGEFILKYNVNQFSEIPPFSLAYPIALATSPAILGIALILIGTFLWLSAMSKFQLSFMYPFLSLNYIVIVVGASLILNEPITPPKIIALTLISAGLILISKSPNCTSLREIECST